MHYTQTISSPLGNILLSADEVGLTGLWFDGGRYYADTLPEEHVERETPILMDTKRWLDVYFTGHEPDFTPLLHKLIQVGAVYAIGVPTVVDAATLTLDVLEEAGKQGVDPAALRGHETVMVTTRDIDEQVSLLSRIVGYGIDLALQPLSFAEISALLG